MRKRDLDAAGLLTRFSGHEHDNGQSADTIAVDQRRLRLLMEWLAPLGALEANGASIESFLEAQGLTEGSFNRYLETIRRFYRWTISEGLADTDPTSAIATRSRPSRRPAPRAGTMSAPGRHFQWPIVCLQLAAEDVSAATEAFGILVMAAIGSRGPRQHDHR